MGFIIVSHSHETDHKLIRFGGRTDLAARVLYGASLTHGGRSPTHVGCSLTHVGRSLTHIDRSLTHVGRSLTHVGRSLTYVGRSLTHAGRLAPFIAAGPSLCFRRCVSQVF